MANDHQPTPEGNGPHVRRSRERSRSRERDQPVPSRVWKIQLQVQRRLVYTWTGRTQLQARPRLVYTLYQPTIGDVLEQEQVITWEQAEDLIRTPTGEPIPNTEIVRTLTRSKVWYVHKYSPVRGANHSRGDGIIESLRISGIEPPAWYSNSLSKAVLQVKLTGP